MKKIRSNEFSGRQLTSILLYQLHQKKFKVQIGMNPEGDIQVLAAKPEETAIRLKILALSQIYSKSPKESWADWFLRTSTETSMLFVPEKFYVKRRRFTFENEGEAKTKIMGMFPTEKAANAYVSSVSDEGSLVYENLDVDKFVVESI